MLKKMQDKPVKTARFSRKPSSTNGHYPERHLLCACAVRYTTCESESIHSYNKFRTMRFHVRHKTVYEYSELANLSHNHVCLQPRNTQLQCCLQTVVNVSPEPDNLQQENDVYANVSTRFYLSNQHKQCEIVVSSLVETTNINPMLPQSIPAQDNLAALENTHSSDALMASDCLLASPYISLDNVVDELIKEIPAHNTPVVEYAQRLMGHIFETFDYTSGFSTLVTPLSEIYEERKGVCQDFAHLAIAALRKQRIPARYVSGYLETLPPLEQKNCKVPMHRMRGFQCSMPNMAGLISPHQQQATRCSVHHYGLGTRLCRCHAH